MRPPTRPGAGPATVVPGGDGHLPNEKFVLLADLDGSAGRYRAPLEKCVLMEANDQEAIDACWHRSGRAHPTTEGDLSSTERSYRKEAERLLLWSILQRKKALSSLSDEDATAYRTFLPIRRRPVATPGITSDGRRCGGRSKGR